MRTTLTETEIKEGWNLHNKIKYHDFRKDPQPYLFDEYVEEFKKLFKLFPAYTPDGEYIDENGFTRFTYPFREGDKKMCNVTWSSKPQSIYIDRWSIPNIALLSESIHDFNAIVSFLRSSFASKTDYNMLLAKFIEMTEIQLMLVHSLLEGKLVSSVKFPKPYKDGYNEVTLIQNPLFDGSWTFPCYAEESLYVK